MNAPLLSVIMPVLRGEFLREAVETVQRSEVDAEIIIIDDGSTDDTAQLAPAISDSIVYVRQENAGPAAARNRGLELARGQFIGFLDADDLWANGHPAGALRYLQQHKDVDLALGQVLLLARNGDAGKFEPAGKVFHTYQLGAVVARHEIFQRVGFFNPAMRYGEDVDWFLRARETGATMATLPEPALYYRLHAANQPHVYERSRAGLLGAFHESLQRRRQTSAVSNSPRRPLVSVILPVFNGERYVAEAIASVIAQDYRPLELIVVDDGSTDRTCEVVRGIPEATLIEESHRGAGAARNAGVRAAKGELISFIDADDLWTPNKLTAQIETLNTDPSLDAVFGHLTEFREDDQDTQSPAVAAPLLSAMLIKRSCFERIGRFDDEATTLEGVDWYLRALEQGLQSRILPDVVYRRRVHASNRGIANRDLNGYIRAIKSSLDRRRAAGSSSQHAHGS